jgi:hypothetical protein
MITTNYQWISFSVDFKKKSNVHILYTCNILERSSVLFAGRYLIFFFHAGGEWDYVILSTVRSMPSYSIEQNPTDGWCRQNLGFITDRNQVNVALTRARRGLIIVGMYINDQ